MMVVGSAATAVAVCRGVSGGKQADHKGPPVHDEGLRGEQNFASVRLEVLLLFVPLLLMLLRWSFVCVGMQLLQRLLMMLGTQPVLLM